jgi:nucleotide-binding universal stress UspA family protein
VEFADELPADLLVLGRHHGGLIDRLVGGTARRVLRHLPCPLLVYKARPFTLPRHILVPVDLSAPSRQALDTAIDHAVTFEADIRVVYVFEHPEFYPGFPVDAWKVIQDTRESEMDSLDALLAEVDWRGIKHGVVRRDGEPTHEILEEADQGATDLVIMGSSGRTGFERMLVGSIAESVVTRCPVSVMVVKAGPPRA